jgi:hypothetical protein
MSDIFISYARTDKARAELLAHAFSRQGWSVWWDREIPPGKSFDEVIESALNSARCVVVLWSKESVSSRWVKTEAAEGAARGILVPVFIDRVQPPLEFRRIEAADLSDWHGASPHAEFDQLLRTVGGLVTGSDPRLVKRMAFDAPARSRAWWRSTRGIFGALAALVIAAVALLLVFQRTSLFRASEQQPAQTQPQSTPAANEVSSPANSGVRSSEPQAAGQSPPAAKPRAAAINLLSQENGGHVVAATNDRWVYTIDGDEKNWQYLDVGLVGAWAVYAFKDEKPATFDTFKVLILESASWNVNEFELLAGNESATGKFESLGKFHTQNIRFFKDPYQEFNFSPVTARFFKVRVLSSHGFGSIGAYEFQLLGAVKG